MTLSFTAHLNHRRLRAAASRLSMVWLPALALTLGLASPGGAVGTGVLEQLTGDLGTDGCVSKDGTSSQCGVQPLLSSPTGVAASGDGKHVYVAGNGSSNNVLIFTRNKSAANHLSKGTLIPAGTTTAGGGPRGVIVSPDGKNVYVTSSNGLFFFSRNNKSGGLTLIGCASKTNGTCTTTTLVQQLNGPEGLAISKDGKSVYVAARGLQGVIAFARNKTTGALAPITNGCVSEGGVADGCGSAGRGLKGATDVAVSLDGAHVYVTADTSDAVSIFKRSKQNGSLTQLTGTDGCWSQTGQDGTTGPAVCNDGRGLNGANGVVATADGKFVYVTSSVSNAIALFSRDKKTGKLTQASDTTGCVSQDGKDGNTAAICTAADIGGLDQVQKVVVSQDGRNLYTTASQSNAVSSFTRDTTTGDLTQLNCVSSTDLACDPGVATKGAQGIAITKDGKNVYTTAPSDNAVDALKRD